MEKEVLYKIKDWDVHFENAKSRQRKSCVWCPLPNKQDGLGYGRLLMEENGAALYGAFVALILMASKQKCPRSGHLTDTGCPQGVRLTATDISIKTKIPAEIIQQMLDVTCSESIGWVERVRDVDTQQTPHIRDVDTKTLKMSPEEKRREGNRREEEEKGRVRLMAEEVLENIPEFRSLGVEKFMQAIHDAGENPRLLENHQEFIRDMSNSLELPKVPPKTYGRYLQSDGLKKKAGETNFE